MASAMIGSCMRHAARMGSHVRTSPITHTFRTRTARIAAVAPRLLSTTTAVREPHPSESFLSGTNAVYAEEMYREWKQDPSSVHASWRNYFQNVEAGLQPGAAFIAPPSIQPGVTPVAATSASHDSDLVRAVNLVRSFQVRGHEVSNLDPLGLQDRKEIAELDYRTYGFSEADLDKTVNFGGTHDVKGFLSTAGPITLRSVIEHLESVYCGTVGYEYMHISDREKCNWIRERIEADPEPFTKEDHKLMLDRMTFAESFENFLGLKYGSYKRFGLDGCESLIPGMKTLIDRATELATEYIVIGMPHRGRLNVLSNVIRKPAEEVFQDFDDAVRREEEGFKGSGDVKYHLGTSYDRSYPDGRSVHLSLVANPSHLEAVNPVVVGKVRAAQDRKGDTTRDKCMGILMHGDAAFSGQGVVYETLHLAQLRKYTTGGTIHIVVNNQVGFTTNPRDSRSSDHPSDVGKAFNVPIFHVNADDVEAVCRVFKLAAEYRQEFHTDVIIDLIGYRRFGHNEGDQPMFTQPKMYTTIKNHPTTLKLYRQQLIDAGHVTAEEAASIQAFVDKSLADAFDNRNDHVPKPTALESVWEKCVHPHVTAPPRLTGVSEAQLRAVGDVLTTVPEGFTLHNTLKRTIAAKAKMFETGVGFDWATAEALAFGSLLMEGNTVRLSGQDVQRGTFSHRHSKWHDQKDFSRRYMPLANLSEKQGQFVAANSSLSEFGVLGFEVGYSQHHPDQLVLWEAQFGDFANGAQVMTDQYVSCSEQKWLRQLGLVMLLPHGHDGAGPEHSSARLERYLQMCDDPEDEVPDMDERLRRQIQAANWQIVNVTTPANYFHVLRRQVVRPFRKPLIVMSPKALLRHPECVSNLEDFEEGTKFKRFIPDDEVTSAKRLLMCTGKVYYELAARRAELEANNIAIARVEQIAPFPFDLVAKEVAKHPDAEVFWVQEEPRNQGAWTYVRPRIETAVQHFNTHDADAFRVKYIGRPTSAATAVGSASWHKASQAKLINAAIDLGEE